ncbi:DUF2059 domain-containing protein [Mesobaculum littorinae]|uniref:DUF2059 domain-containing protein n=1 Tax=Mesobaculum littorinae TaxID=2486419 RepID=A0A438AJN3_9RHOB|nr:DUF2059 domain-containing protein [Mesobaculum littorinae]RVV98888.1 DUF2059 domain-containing protein [Mesobaculum littorinae]
MRSPVIALPLIAALALPAFAETREERLEVASDYVELTLEDMDLDALLAQMYEPIFAQVEAGGGEVTDEQREEVKALYSEKMMPGLRDIMEEQDEVMADLLSYEEIVALRDFYATDEGRSVMRKMPEIMARQQPQIMNYVQTTMPEVMPELQRILEPAE